LAHLWSTDLRSSFLIGGKNYWLRERSSWLPLGSGSTESNGHPLSQFLDAPLSGRPPRTPGLLHGRRWPGGHWRWIDQSKVFFCRR